MKKLFAAMLGLSLMVGGAWALTVPLTDIVIPGVDAEGAPDDVNTGLASGKANVNLDKGTFSASLKGTAPNASGAKAKFEQPFSQEVEGVLAEGDGDAKYAKPKKKTPGVSSVKAKAKGTLGPI